jgi:predicted nucleic acid-binding protein
MDGGGALIVVDTNLLVALAVKNENSGLAVSILERDADWVAPPIWESEFRNAMLGMIRAGIIGHAAAVSAHKFAADTVQVFTPSTGAVLRIAETHNLSAYDAEFASLAEWLEIPCLSFDDDLLKPALATHPKNF